MIETVDKHKITTNYSELRSRTDDRQTTSLMVMYNFIRGEGNDDKITEICVTYYCKVETQTS